LNDVEKNWSTIEKEAYAIVHAVKQFYPYLYGRRFQVLSDHKPLRELLRKKETSAKLARWALCLQDYDIAIDYRAGKVNQNADCLSRIPETDGATTTQPEVTPVINALTNVKFAEEQEKDKYCKGARTAVHSSTGYSPFYLMYGREATEPQDMIQPVRNRDMTDVNMIFSQMWYDAVQKTKEKLEEAKEIQKKYYDRNAKRVEFEVGDIVMLKEMANIPGKFNMRWEGPFSITERKGNVNYKIKTERNC
jgi:hypothetical protein